MPFQSSPNRLSLLRKQNGLSQKQLAALVSQDRTTISMYECGRVVPPLSCAAMFQLLFGVPIAEIFPDLFHTLERRLQLNRQKRGNRMPERVLAT
jgi:DNA-binding XRE family transcriptional regulator